MLKEEKKNVIKEFSMAAEEDDRLRLQADNKIKEFFIYFLAPRPLDHTGAANTKFVWSRK